MFGVGGVRIRSSAVVMFCYDILMGLFALAEVCGRWPMENRGVITGRLLIQCTSVNLPSFMYEGVSSAIL